MIQRHQDHQGHGVHTTVLVLVCTARGQSHGTLEMVTDIACAHRDSSFLGWSRGAARLHLCRPLPNSAHRRLATAASPCSPWLAPFDTMDTPTITTVVPPST